MNIPIEKSSKIAIFGYGVEGRSTFKFLKENEYKNVDIFDENLNEENVNNDLNKLKEYDLIFRSPGIHKNHPKLAGLNVTSATKLFFDLCPCPIIGVTGTKGKGTTSTLIYEIIGGTGKDMYIGGNIGTPALDFVDNLDEESLVILELSSFQLHDLHKSPHIAVVLNTTSEHLDYHEDNEEYLAAKESIVKFQGRDDFAVLNLDYPYYKRYEKLGEAERFFVSAKKAVNKGAYEKHGKIYLEEDELCKTDEVGLIGPHNIENIMPAIMVARILRMPDNVIKQAIIDFKGLPHRLEFVRKYKDIKFYNDSFSTTPETCIAAIRSFKEPIILIGGGSEKKSDYTELGREIGEKDNVKKVILMGPAGEKIKEAIGPEQEVVVVKKYKDAFDLALEEAWKGYIILLSPAAASFDQFKNYKERGQIFKKWVESLE